MSGAGAFETLRAVAGDLPLWDRHLARLATAAERLGMSYEPPASLRDRARALLLRQGHGDDVLRITLSAGRGGAPSWNLASRPRPEAGPVRLHPVSADRPAGDPTAGFKSTSRAFYDAAQAAAAAAGADDALLVDREGRVLETATANVLVALDGELWTPPLDGRIVPGIARALLLEGAAAAGQPVREAAVPEARLTTASGLWVTNAVHGPRPGFLAGAERPAGIGAVGELLGEIWGRALGLDAP